jgi:hypothetical protein
MSANRIGLVALLGAALAGCGTAPPFHPLKGGVGYSDTQLQDNRFSVSFAGDSSTPRDKVEQFLLYRAAQLTLANGYDHFVVADEATDRSTEYHGFGGPAWIGPGWYRPGWRSWWGVDPVLNDVEAVPSDRFNATATITLKMGPAPPGRPQAYDARQLVDRLAPLIAAASED